MCTEDTAVAVGNLSSLKRNIRNYRHRYLPKEPINSDFNIPEEWKTTMWAEPRSFMIFDSEQPDSRILIFASDFAINILAKSESWFMGGTFKCSSNMFQQLYVIRGEYESKVFTCVYAFLSNK